MDQQVSELLNYLKLVKKRGYLFVAVALAVMTAAIAYCYSLPKAYQADSTVFVESNVINNLVKGLAVSPDTGDPIRVIKFALLSRDNLRKTLQEVRPELVSEEKIQETIASLQKETEISTNGKELFKVSIVHTNPVFAQQYINTLISTYVKGSLIGKREETAGASQFLDQQLAQFRNKLDQAEDNIIAFRKSLGGSAVMDEKSLLDAITAYRRQIEEIDLSLSTLKNRRKQLQSEPTASVATTTVGGQVESEEVQLQKRLQELLRTYTENYPEVIRIRSELAVLQQQQKPGQTTANDVQSLRDLQAQEHKQALASFDAQIRSLADKKATLQQFMQQREVELKQLPETQKTLTALVQQRDSYRAIYEEMLLRLNQSEVSRQMELGDQAKTFRVVDSALLPIDPIYPDMAKLILMAISAGLACGFGAVVLKENLNTAVSNVGQLRELGVEILAMVPVIVDDRLQARARRRDWMVFASAGIYFSAIVGLFVFEMFKRMKLF